MRFLVSTRYLCRTVICVRQNHLATTMSVCSALGVFRTTLNSRTVRDWQEIREYVRYRSLHPCPINPILRQNQYTQATKKYLLRGYEVRFSLCTTYSLLNYQHLHQRRYPSPNLPLPVLSVLIPHSHQALQNPLGTSDMHRARLACPSCAIAQYSRVASCTRPSSLPRMNPQPLSVTMMIAKR